MRAERGGRSATASLLLATALTICACGSGPATPTAAGPKGSPATASSSGVASPSAPSASRATSTEGPVTAAPAPTPSPPPTIGPAPALRLQPVATVPNALAIADSGDGSGRLFVAAQDGRIWSVLDGQREAGPVLDIAGRIATGGERGLLGLAFHPRF